MRFVKFTPEEMAYDVPADTSHLRFRRVNPPLIVLESDVAKVFTDSRTVNKALRKVIELQNLAQPGVSKRRKSA